jgi:large subunit ribosomal protein L5
MAEPKNEKGAPKAAAKKDAKPGKGGEAKTASAKARDGAAATPFTAPVDYTPRLKKHYNEVVREQLIKQFG